MVKVKKKLKSHFKSFDEEYKEPTSFQLTILHPYLSYLMKRMTNPCYKDAEFVSIMKGTHVIGGSDHAEMM